VRFKDMVDLDSPCTGVFQALLNIELRLNNSVHALRCAAEGVGETSALFVLELFEDHRCSLHSSRPFWQLDRSHVALRNRSFFNALVLAVDFKSASSHLRTILR